MKKILQKKQIFSQLTLKVPSLHRSDDYAVQCNTHLCASNLNYEKNLIPLVENSRKRNRKCRSLFLNEQIHQ